MFVIWSAMREAAIFRHRILHNFLRDEWGPHMTLIKRVYGW